MRDQKEVHVELSFGEGTAVLRRSGSTKLAVAVVLGSETNPETGKQTVWLDRLVHRSQDSKICQGDIIWTPSGAISTVLTQQ